MTEPKFPTLSHGCAYTYPYDQGERYGVFASEFENGSAELATDWEFPVRTFGYRCATYREDDIDKVMGFLRARQRLAEAFYIDSFNKIWSPWDDATLSTAAGGALTQRTYYAKYTFSDGTSETNVCGQGESSQLVALNYYLTVQTEPFPPGVSEAWLYIGTSSGSLYYSGMLGSTNGTWTQDTAATTVDSDSAAGQKILKVTATTNFQAGDPVIVNSGGDREEFHIIASIAAGDSLTMEDNLAFLHTQVQGDAVATTIANANFDGPPTENSLDGEEVRVRLVGDIATPVLRGRVYSLEMVLEELK